MKTEYVSEALYERITEHDANRGGYLDAGVTVKNPDGSRPGDQKFTPGRLLVVQSYYNMTVLRMKSDGELISVANEEYRPEPVNSGGN